jgi:hypothetical protein
MRLIWDRDFSLQNRLAPKRLGLEAVRPWWKVKSVASMRSVEATVENPLYDGAAIYLDANIDRVWHERHVGDVQSDIPFRPCGRYFRDGLDMR